MSGVIPEAPSSLSSTYLQSHQNASPRQDYLSCVYTAYNFKATATHFLILQALKLGPFLPPWEQLLFRDYPTSKTCRWPLIPPPFHCCEPEKSEARIKRFLDLQKQTNHLCLFFSSEDQQIPTDLGQDNSMDKKLLFYPFSEPVFPTFHFPSLSQFLICGDLGKFLNGLGSM